MANSISNLRIAIDSNKNILSISYKKGGYGYVIYDNGNSYQLTNDYFLNSVEYGGNPITKIIFDESKIGLIPGYTKIN